MQKVLDESMIPHFAEGDFATGLNECILHLHRELTGGNLDAPEDGIEGIHHSFGCDSDQCHPSFDRAAN
jgi:uncharacterized membrane protein YgcG